MNINWKRLFATLGIVVVTATVLGSLTWIGLLKIVQEKEGEIQLLATRSSELSQVYLQKFQEKKAAEETKTATGTTQKARNTSTSATDSQEEASPQSQIYFFYNPSCGACIAQMPIVQELQSEGIPFIFCDVIAHPDYISQYGITSVPTFILNGHRQGFSSKEQLQNFWNIYK